MAILHFTVVFGFYIFEITNFTANILLRPNKKKVSISQLHKNFFPILQGYLFYNFTALILYFSILQLKKRWFSILQRTYCPLYQLLSLRVIDTAVTAPLLR